MDGLDGVTSVIVNPDGDRVYTVSMLDNGVTVFCRDETSGALSYIETEWDGINGVDGLYGAILAALSPDGRHVYVAGFGDDAVAVFERQFYIFLPLVLLLLTKLLYPLPAQRIEGGDQLIRDELTSLGPANRGEWATLVVFLSTATLWITRPLLASATFGANGGGWAPLAGLTDAGIAIVAAITLFLIPVDVKRRQFAMDWETAVQLPWGVLVLFGGGLSLAAAVQTNAVGDFLGSHADGIWYTNNSSGSWSEAVTIDQIDASAYHPSITCDNNNSLHVVFVSNDSLYYLNNLSGDWGTPELVTTGGIFPNIVTDENGKAHIAWYTQVEYGALYYSNNIDGSWLTPAYITIINTDILKCFTKYTPSIERT